jgi:hypothetical protein
MGAFDDMERMPTRREVERFTKANPGVVAEILDEVSLRDAALDAPDATGNDYTICPECGSPDPLVHYTPQDHRLCANVWHWRHTSSEHTAC